MSLKCLFNCIAVFLGIYVHFCACDSLVLYCCVCAFYSISYCFSFPCSFVPDCMYQQFFVSLAFVKNILLCACDMKLVNPLAYLCLVWMYISLFTCASVFLHCLYTSLLGCSCFFEVFFASWSFSKYKVLCTCVLLLVYSFVSLCFIFCKHLPLFTSVGLFVWCTHCLHDIVCQCIILLCLCSCVLLFMCTLVVICHLPLIMCSLVFLSSFLCFCLNVLHVFFCTYALLFVGALVYLCLGFYMMDYLVVFVLWFMSKVLIFSTTLVRNVRGISITYSLFLSSYTVGLFNPLLCESWDDGLKTSPSKRTAGQMRKWRLSSYFFGECARSVQLREGKLSVIRSYSPLK